MRKLVLMSVTFRSRDSMRAVAPVAAFESAVFFIHRVDHPVATAISKSQEVWSVPREEPVGQATIDKTTHVSYSHLCASENSWPVQQLLQHTEMARQASSALYFSRKVSSGQDFRLMNTYRVTRRTFAQDSHLPRVAQPSFWSSLIPKPLRTSATPNIKPKKSKEWNPATVFICLGILVGSNAIQIIALRNQTLKLSRQAEAKISLLREVVQRVKNGENVDVKGLLGTGNPESEIEWEEVVKELEETDNVEEGRKRRDAKRAEKSRLQEEKEMSKGQKNDTNKSGANARDDGEGRKPKFLM